MDKETKQWEIWKSAYHRFNGKRKLTRKDFQFCLNLHRRYHTRAVSSKVCSEMKRQGIVCVVRKRKEV